MLVASNAADRAGDLDAVDRVAEMAQAHADAARARMKAANVLGRIKPRPWLI
jgi:hypothetical protein